MRHGDGVAGGQEMRQRRLANRSGPADEQHAHR